MSGIGIAICLEPDLEAEIIREIESRELPLKIVRRCRDITEILATSKSQLVEMVIVDTEIIDLDVSARDDLSRGMATVIALAPLDDLEYLGAGGGISVLTKMDPRTPEITESELERILSLAMQLMMPPPPPSPHQDKSFATDFPVESAGQSGKIIACWGPSGSTGKSSLVVNLASFLRSYGKVLLVDADTVDPALVQMLGISLETSGVVMGCRLAQRGQLNEQNFAQIVTQVGSQVDLLSGMNKGGRWREIGAKSLAALVEWARAQYAWILVDLAAGADDPDDPFAEMGPSRHSAQMGVLSVADLVVEVGLADPVGLRRLVVNHEQAMSWKLWQCPTLVVVNRGRPGVGGLHWEKSLRQVLAQFLPGISGVILREAGEDFDRALVAGCDIATVNPEAPVLADFHKLQNQVLQLMGVLPSRMAEKKPRKRSK